jgi:hypothetical protein
LALIVRRPKQSSEAVIDWYLAGQFVLVAFLWLFYDRIALGFVPMAIVALMAGRGIQRASFSIATVALFGAICIVGTYDHLRFNGALWKSVAYLRSRGAADSEINAGYPVNGWLQYAHPENAPRDSSGHLAVPAVTAKMNLKYRVSAAPARKGKLIATIPTPAYSVGEDRCMSTREKPPPGNKRTIDRRKREDYI